MTFGELQTEVYSRGFNFLNQDAAGRTRVKRWLNEAYLWDVCEAAPWTFLRTSTSGTAPLTIADLADVIWVADSTNDQGIAELDEKNLQDFDPTLDETGRAERWYMTSETTMAVWPVDTTSTFQVTYRKVPAELAADGDTPVVPSRFHNLIVDGAVIRAYRDSDEFDAADRLQIIQDMGLERMKRQLLRHGPDPQFAVINNGI